MKKYFIFTLVIMLSLLIFQVYANATEAVSVATTAEITMKETIKNVLMDFVKANKDGFLDYVQPFLNTIANGIFIFILGFAFVNLRKYSKNETLNAVLDKVETFLITRIKFNNAVVISDLIKDLKSKDNYSKEDIEKLVKAEKVKLGQQALKDVKEIIGDKGVKVLDEHFKDGNKKLNEFFEGLVDDLKK